MRVYQSLDEFERPENGCVLTIGNFDGVHLGHQAIFEHALSLAQAESLPMIGLTFQPAPVKLLRPDKAPRILTPLTIKIILLEKQKLDALIVLKATSEFLVMSAKDFVAKILVEQMSVRHIVEGQTFNFGRLRTGTMVDLKAYGKEFGFISHMVPSRNISLKGFAPVAVSSSLIRQQIMTCQFDKARQGLGRWYDLFGKVVSGRHQGRQLGFPTANLELDSADQLIPEDGVFAGWARSGADAKQAWESKKIYPAAISIGRPETFADATWQIEAHLLDYNNDKQSLYQQYMLLSPIMRIRLQQKFKSSEALTDQIKADCQAVRQILLEKGLNPT